MGEDFGLLQHQAERALFISTEQLSDDRPDGVVTHRRCRSVKPTIHDAPTLYKSVRDSIRCASKTPAAMRSVKWPRAFLDKMRRFSYTIAL